MLPTPPGDDLLEEIGRLLREQDHDLADETWWLDTRSSRLVVAPDPDERTDEELADDPALPDWQRDERALAREIAADTEGHFVQVPRGSGGDGRLHAFARTLADGPLADEVWSAMRGGRGAYRRVRDVLHRHGRLQDWFDFEVARDREEARAWLVQVGLLADDE
jgi:hypothetical protein